MVEIWIMGKAGVVAGRVCWPFAASSWSETAAVGGRALAGLWFCAVVEVIVELATWWLEREVGSRHTEDRKSVV